MHHFSIQSLLCIYAPHSRLRFMVFWFFSCCSISFVFEDWCQCGRKIVMKISLIKLVLKILSLRKFIPKFKIKVWKGLSCIKTLTWLHSMFLEWVLHGVFVWCKLFFLCWFVHNLGFPSLDWALFLGISSPYTNRPIIKNHTLRFSTILNLFTQDQPTTFLY